MVNYIPILTSLFALFFVVKLYKHYISKPQAIYMLWWTLGVFTYGLGTITESINALAGWSPLNTRIWYIVGALLGGFPLAQGTVFLLFKKKTAYILTAIVLTAIIIDSVAIFLSPILLPEHFDFRLSGKVFEWHWVRYFSPFINTYSFVFLFGGAVYSAYKYAKLGRSHPRFLGNIFISIGALLPGIGGSFTRLGYVEVLFITELIGLICIYLGYIIMQRDKTISVHQNQTFFK